MDSFKKLLDEEEQLVAIPEQKLRDIERKVHNSMQPVRFAASTTELFLPRAVDTFLALFGTRNTKKAPKAPPAPPSHHSDPASGNW